jgi:hypothetical protein
MPQDDEGETFKYDLEQRDLLRPGRCRLQAIISIEVVALQITRQEQFACR